MDNNCAAVILSSGLSERMGKPKALLQWDDSTTFIEKTINEYIKAGCDKIICTVNKINEPLCKSLNLQSNVMFVLNEHPEWGRFYSIRIASQEAKVSDFCFIQNIDNPFVSSEIIDRIWENRDLNSWCSPIYKGKGGHPVLLSQGIIQQIHNSNKQDITLHDILKPFQRVNIEVDTDTILRNINTPEEYSKYFSI